MGRTARQIDGLNTSARRTDTDTTRAQVGRHRLRRNAGSGAGNAARLEGINGIGNEAMITGLDEIASGHPVEGLDQIGTEHETDDNPLNDAFILEEDEKIEIEVPDTGNTGVIPEGEKEPNIEDVIRQDESLEILEGIKEKEPKSEEEEEREGEIILENRDPDSVIDELERTQSRMIILNDRKREGFARAGDRQGENIASQTGNELRRINQSMQQVRGWNFVPVPAQRQGHSLWRKFWTRATTAFALVTRVIVTAVTAPISGLVRSRAVDRLSRAERNMQQAKDYKTIPGWDGAKYEEAPQGQGGDILDDFRRVPMVWSYPTAAEAETGSGENKKIKDPEFTVYVNQPTLGSAEHMTNFASGHTSIGLEYSRYSNVTKRYERYQLKYGFYPAGVIPTPSNSSPAVMVSFYGATIPGQLRDEKSHFFSISRRYPTTMEKVRLIVRESEKYAGRGYNAFDRNCTTFAKEMAVLGEIPGTDEIFERHEVEVSPLMNIARWVGGGGTTFAKSSMYNQLAGLSEKEDLSYQNFGNKRLTREETTRYLNSLDNFSYFGSSDLPAEVAEGLRLQTGPGTGTISSFRADEILDEDVLSEAPNLDTMQDRLSNADTKLKGIITSVVTEAKLASAPGPVRSFMDRLPETGLQAVQTLINSYYIRADAEQSPPLHEVLSLDEIRSARQSFQSDLDGISRDYAVLFGSDKRLYIPFMDFMTVLQLTIKQMDNIYEERMKIEGAGERNGDLGNIAKAFFSDKKKIEFGDGKGTMIRMNLTPSQYETYIQVFKDPLTGLRKMNRYTSIANKRESDRTDDEKKEYKEMQKYWNLFSDFEKSHRYMLERENFSQQDIDYAFSLGKREWPDSISGDIFETGSSAGAIYQMLILEKIFGGMREAYLREEADGGISENALLDLQKDPAETGGLQAWLKTYITGCIERYPERFGMILQGLSKVNSGKTTKVMEDFGMMLQFYITRTFINGMGNERVRIAADRAGNVWLNLFYTDEAFRSYIQKMVP